METLQTLDRGVDALMLVARHPEGVTVKDVAEHLQVHRAIAHRVVATLAAHALVSRGAGGRYRLGPAIPRLNQAYTPHVVAAARPVLRDLSRTTQATSFLAVADGAECVAVAVEEVPDQVLQLAYRVGARHPLGRGAAGLAILRGRLPVCEQGPGWVFTEGQLQAGAAGVAAPLGRVDLVGVEASVGVVVLGDVDEELTGPQVTRAAAVILRALAQAAE